METLDTIVTFLGQLVWGPEIFPWLIALLLGTGIFITFKLGFLQLFSIKHGFDVVRGKYDDPTHAGDINHFKALSTALSATVGIGNITGVALALSWGGPGAIFWMWVTAIFGMALKYAECTLALNYRVFDKNGEAAGGPMYTIEKGLGPKWKPAAVLFSLCAIFSSLAGGSMAQSNSIKDTLGEFQWGSYWLNNHQYIIGVGCALLVGLVILGGIKRIANFSSILAPSMALLYVASALVILILHIQLVPEAFASIFTEAFNPTATITGTVSGTLMSSLTWGIKRGLFSNEAGQGSAPIAHAAAKTDEPVREGVVAMLGPFIDTLIICSLTALVILVTGQNNQYHLLNLSIDDVEVVHIQEGEFSSQYERVNAAKTVEKITIDTNKPFPENIKLKHNKVFLKDIQFLGGGSDQDIFTNILTIENGKIQKAKGLNSIQAKGIKLGAVLTGQSFKVGLQKIFPYGDKIVTLCVFLFALSTIISWSYYGERCTLYLFGEAGIIPYRILHTFSVFLGAVLSIDIVWNFADVTNGLMAVPNLLTVLLLAGPLSIQTKKYFDKMKLER